MAGKTFGKHLLSLGESPQFNGKVHTPFALIHAENRENGVNCKIIIRILMKLMEGFFLIVYGLTRKKERKNIT